MDNLWALTEGPHGGLQMLPSVTEPLMVCDRFEFVGRELERWYNITGRVFESRLAMQQYKAMRFDHEYLGYCEAAERVGRGVKLFDGRNFGVL